MPDTLSLPVPAQEVSALADLIFQFAEGRAVDDSLRRMLASRATQMPFGRMRVHWGSLAPDLGAKSTYFIAVDGVSPVLLHIALSLAPGSGLFPGSALIGRMRTRRGLEVVVNALPFGSSDGERILTYAQALDRTVLPGPQGVDTFFLAASSDGDAAFEQFQAVKSKYGLTVAAWAGPAPEGIWGAIRHGWRGGFPLRGGAPPASRRFLDGSVVDDDELKEQIDDVRRLNGRTCDIDVAFDPPGTLTEPAALTRRLEALRSRGRSVQVVEVQLGLRPEAPYPETVGEMTGWPEGIVSNVQWRAGGNPLVELRQRVEELQRAARLYGAILGVNGYGSATDATLQAIGQGAGRRLWFTLGGGVASSRILALAALLRG